MDNSFLNDMSREELEKLRKDIDAQIEKNEVQAKNEALAKVNETLSQYGLKPEDLFSTSKATGKVTKGVPKYANPADPTQTWTGRGRKPNWVQEALDAGRSMDELRI